MGSKLSVGNLPCCATDCCQSGCDDCPYDYKDGVDPSIPAELSNEPITEDLEDS